MKLSRSQSIALVALLALAALVVVVASRNPQPPLLPPDEAHAGPVEGCLDCHGPDDILPRSADHPLGRDCRRCHGSRER